MNEKIWISCLAVLCIGFGLAKSLRPQFFLELRRRHTWFDLFDVYSSIFKSKHAEKAVQINGYLLLAIGCRLVAWLVFK